ncbi:hypothetical protein BCR15_07315 [Tessaracoccus lapidicaptus]|uniref:Cobalamin adenosyltransferase-like domain-containing protein n=1 Tax=Tessaracoccus lapidicaptus TaxID=1427523 RepID=A0A1C0AKI4_9ACTN|nr:MULTISPECIES: hypothetical protein [Tessaracoccus]AQX16861.1 hypothetical protein BKM78_13765 [Tessaracoccus sp. T2.5-30]OCL33077.1 hypothetical protein BCR15_07315 [Tessaracoccus lapidicaptus]VEP41650.1 hypothetical protein TLA_TLA_02773 [Tessaracoccus lapidicaptus]
MSVVTEADLRAQLRRPEHGATVSIAPGARLSPSAQDFVKQWSLVVAEDGPAPGPPAASVGTAWDRPAEFPVRLEGDLPCCTTCGTPVKKKVSSLTQLNASHYAPKTHPRIVLRGRVDSLLAFTMLAQSRALTDGHLAIAEHLGTLAAYCRELTSAEYGERPVAPLALRDVSADELHRATHQPDKALGIPHLTIDGASVELQHWLNVCRTQSRELEITALEAFESPHHPYGESICHAMNRLSSAFYYLQLLLEAGRS